MLLHKTDDMLVQIVSVDAAINCAIGLGGGLPGHPGDYRFGEGAVPHERLSGGWLVGSGAELTESVGELPRVFVEGRDDDDARRCVRRAVQRRRRLR